MQHNSPRKVNSSSRTPTWIKHKIILNILIADKIVDKQIIKHIYRYTLHAGQPPTRKMVAEGLAGVIMTVVDPEP